MQSRAIYIVHFSEVHMDAITGLTDVLMSVANA